MDCFYWTIAVVFHSTAEYKPCVMTVRFYFHFMPTFFFFFFFTYGCHMTYLVIGSHVGHMIGHLTCHLTWAHDQSCDHGLLFFSHMSHYDSLIVFHLFLPYNSLYLICYAI